jgi:hypothetical protein
VGLQLQQTYEVKFVEMQKGSTFSRHIETMEILSTEMDEVARALSKLATPDLEERLLVLIHEFRFEEMENGLGLKPEMMALQLVETDVVAHEQ